jgi:hypothetical protein
LKYPRRPGPDLGPIYKLDDKKLIPRQKEEEPMFKGLRTSEKSIIPTQLEIPFLQERMAKLLTKKYKEKIKREIESSRAKHRYILDRNLVDIKSCIKYCSNFGLPKFFYITFLYHKCKILRDKNKLTKPNELKRKS